MMRLSGLQTDVLVLYRALLKSAVAKTAQKGSDKTVKATQSELYQFGKSCFPFFVLQLIRQKCLCCSHTTVRQEFREKTEERLSNDRTLITLRPQAKKASRHARVYWCFCSA